MARLWGEVRSSDAHRGLPRELVRESHCLAMGGDLGRVVAHRIAAALGLVGSWLALGAAGAFAMLGVAGLALGGGAGPRPGRGDGHGVLAVFVASGILLVACGILCWRAFLALPAWRAQAAALDEQVEVRLSALELALLDAAPAGTAAWASTVTPVQPTVPT